MVRLIFVFFEALFWLFVLRLVLRFVAALLAPARAAASRPAARPKVIAAQDLVLDRVCRTYVPVASAITALVAGHEEHFCSAACRDRALAAVARAS
jgi:hypothetical protein